MPLTPDEIADKEFSFGLRGYDQTEVREFLSLVASEVAGGIVIAANLGDGTQTPGTGVQGDQGAEVVGGDAAAAQAAAVLDRAHREAAEIRRSAEAEAEIMNGRTQAVLAAAEAAALRLVAEAQARIDQRLSALPSGGVGGGDQIAIGRSFSHRRCHQRRDQRPGRGPRGHPPPASVGALQGDIGGGSRRGRRGSAAGGAQPLTSPGWVIR